MPNWTLNNMPISDVHFCLFLAPKIKNKNFKFSKITTYKIKIFQIQKTEYIVKNYISTPSVQTFNLISLFLAVQWPKTRVKVMTSLFWISFYVFLIVALQNKQQFWNPETELEKIGMFWKEFFELLNLTLLTWTWPDFWSDMKMSVTIKFYVPDGP